MKTPTRRRFIVMSVPFEMEATEAAEAYQGAAWFVYDQTTRQSSESLPSFEAATAAARRLNSGGEGTR